MATQTHHSSWRTGVLLRTAGVFVALYALAAAWIVATNGEEPDPLRLDRTADGAGIVVSGAVPDDTTRDAIIAAVGTVTGVPLIVARVEVDPDATPLDAPLDTASALADTLPPDGG